MFQRVLHLLSVGIVSTPWSPYPTNLGLLVKIDKKILSVWILRNRPDIPVSLVDRDFVLDFEAYLKVDYRLQANSAEKLMRIFKRITTMCFKSGLMAKDPFCDVRLKKVKKDRGYLTRHELELILNYKPTKKRLEKARDVFVFCCFTGFDYSTTASLTEQNLVLADDGSMWIETHRVKTGVASKVKLLDIPLSILKKYESTRINGYLLPVLSNAKYNLYLKEIAITLGIQKRVTSHCFSHSIYSFWLKTKDVRNFNLRQVTI